jgi:uncharacterized membrane protein
MSNTENSGGGMQPKTVAIVAYLTLIGWIVALVVNSSNKSSLGSFHIRQMAGLILTSLALQLVKYIPVIGPFVSLIGTFAVFVLWILGIVGAFNEEKKPVPFVGELYQKWFSGL